MDKVYLTNLEKEILRGAHRDEICHSDFQCPEDDFSSACRRLKELGFLEIIEYSDVVVEARISDSGIAYKEMNPKLSNPVPEDVKWSRDRRLSILALIIAGASLILSIVQLIWL